MHATNKAAEALVNVDQENKRIMTEFEESKAEQKEQGDRIRELE